MRLYCRSDKLHELGLGHGAGELLYHASAPVQIKSGNAPDIETAHQIHFGSGVYFCYFNYARHLGGNFIQHGMNPQAVRSGRSPEFDENGPGRGNDFFLERSRRHIHGPPGIGENRAAFAALGSASQPVDKHAICGPARLTAKQYRIHGVPLPASGEAA